MRIDLGNNVFNNGDYSAAPSGLGPLGTAFTSHRQIAKHKVVSFTIFAKIGASVSLGKIQRVMTHCAIL